jgi:hypothetical protein
MIRRLGIPVWAVLGAERLDRIEIPDSVSHLILLADNDRAGRRIECRWSPAPHNDWNDLGSGRSGGGVGCGAAN